MIGVYQGPKFISLKLEDWCRENKVRLVFIQPGKPMQNAYIGRCNGGRRQRNGCRITTTIALTRH